ncbi:hypothetical protein Ancab_014490 [Ancistrocladus abbreviatus]
MKEVNLELEESSALGMGGVVDGCNSKRANGEEACARLNIMRSLEISDNLCSNKLEDSVVAETKFYDDRSLENRDIMAEALKGRKAVVDNGPKGYGFDMGISYVG